MGMGSYESAMEVPIDGTTTDKTKYYNYLIIGYLRGVLQIINLEKVPATENT